MKKTLDRINRLVLFARSLAKTVWLKNTKKVFLFGAPFHQNLGDHAQTYCTEVWLSENYPEYRIVTYDTSSASLFDYLSIKMVKLVASWDDIFFLHSGYHATDLYPLEDGLQRKIISTFPNNKIVALPQTINYVSEASKVGASNLFNSHSDITILCRDEVSYAMAKTIFSKCKLLLFPDIVTMMIGDFNQPEVASREGIHLCLRNDIESLYRMNGEDINLYQSLSKIAPVRESDTNSNQNPVCIRRNLKKTLESSWASFASYRVTVTDRYHGTIFSLIAGTPVVVLASTDHKLESGVRWFPKNIFGKYVYYAKSIEDATEITSRIYKESYSYKLPKYFAENYYDILRAKLREGDK